MARAKSDLPEPAAIRALVDDNGRLAIRVTPGARVESMVVDLESRRLLIKIRIKPQDGAANKAVLALLAKALGCAKSRLELVRGEVSRDKLVQL